ncbi:DUF262 domain-containing protein [Selenomonas sp. KH1T6]|uniref:DUF262 domain-containing protein n=1 Tax=Selenomonas sp. KH1T6 TaxID=3158784 RepID=UPI0008A78093|nr:Protein of unknown function DUF262 [Selenomonas ruminantium]
MNIRVSKHLKDMASVNPTKQSQLLPVQTINTMIDHKQIVLPLYQRDVSWTVKQSVELLNYEILGKAPVAPLSFNKIEKNEQQTTLVTFIDRTMLEIDEYNNVSWSVVDGQQRITTNYKAYIDHPDFRNVVLDITRGKFIETNTTFKEGQIPVGKLFNKSDDVFYAATEDYDRPAFQVLQSVRNKYQQYNFTINLATDLNEEEQIRWFEVLNNAGSKVSVVQMRFSRLKAQGFDIYDYTSSYKNAIISANPDYAAFFKPQKTSVSYPVSALNAAFEKITGRVHERHYTPMPSDTKENQLCRLGADKLKECCTMTLDSLNYTLDFITNHRLEQPNRMDHINYLVGYFVYNGKNPSVEDEAKLCRWFSETDFTNTSNSERREIYRKLLIKED